MAQTKKKRRRKHKGTQGGSIQKGARRRPRSREEARAQARRQASSRREVPPTWRGAVNRALIMSGLLFLLMGFIVGESIGAAAALSISMLAIYIPAGYYLERFFYNRRLAAERKRRQQAAADPKRR